MCVYVVLFPRQVCNSLAKFGRMKMRCRRSKCIFMNKFYFAAWNIGLAFSAARLMVSKLVSIETKLSYEMLRRLRWQRVSSDVPGIVFAVV